VVVLDSARLNPYTDEDAQFDNRYLARLPSIEGWRALGIRHVLYVTDGAERELDDLNGDFVALSQAGIDVKLLPLTDFVESPEAPPEGADEPAWWYAFALDGLYYYYGGDFIAHACFWDRYGWYHPVHRVVVGPPTVARATSAGFHYHPQLRTTLFGGGGPQHWPGPTHAVRPPSFGLVQVRTSRADGTVVSVRAGRSGGAAFGGFSSGRSGSFGRFHGGGMSA
jgi:hypothetical protein